MAGFVQIIEFQTSRIDELRDAFEQFQTEAGRGSAGRGMFTKDRDREGHYFNIVEFDSYESAMQNSNRPEVQRFAEQMSQLVDGPVTFHNLDLVETFEP